MARRAPARRRAQYTAADGWASMQIWGMGIASQDLTGDGLPEVYLTSQGDNKLQSLTGRADAARLPRHRAREGRDRAPQPYAGGDALPSTAWHPEFEDVNNDGLIDLFVSKGNVGEVPDYAMQDPSNLLLGQPDGTFVEGAETPGIVSFDKGRGAALADFNQDGLLDLVEVEPRRAGAALAQRRVAGRPMRRRRWAAGSRSGCSQPGGNRDAIGAVIETKAGDAVAARARSSSAAGTSAASSAGSTWGSGPRRRPRSG